MHSETPALWPARGHVELHDELHARPALAVRTPGVVSYWTQWGLAPAQADAALAALCAASGQNGPAPDVRHHVVRGAGFALKFERHGEFVSWQASRPIEQAAAAHDDAALDALLHEARATDALPAAFVRALAGTTLLGATHVVLLRADAPHWFERCRSRLQADLVGDGADAQALLAARMADDQAVVLTDLRLQADGFTRFVVLDAGLPPDQAARAAQRLCEIEAYRMLAMLGFPVAQRESAALGEIERSLQATVDAMANDTAHDDAAALDTLTRLAVEVEHSAARTRYRFSATRAYHRIVTQRLADLRETRIDGLQTLSSFFGRRFAPAMGLCESTDARLTDIAERIGRAVGLAQVRVEVQREATNQELLKTFARRQQMQLRLQQTVEGLSVVAISYYALGMVGYLAKAAKGIALPGGLELQPDVAIGLAVLPVLLAVAWFVRRLRRHFVA